MKNNNVKLTEWSKKFLEENFENGIYVGSGENKQTQGTAKDFEGVIKTLVIHLYPSNDTIVENRESQCESGFDSGIQPDCDGVIDGLFSKAVLYNNEKNVYIIENGVDLVLNSGVPCNTRLFKDGSYVTVYENCTCNRFGGTLLIKPNRDNNV